MALIGLLAACGLSPVSPDDSWPYDDDSWERDCEEYRYGWMEIWNSRDYAIHIHLMGQDDIHIDVSPQSGKRLKLDAGLYLVFPSWDICRAIETCGAFYQASSVTPCGTITLKY